MSFDLINIVHLFWVQWVFTVLKLVYKIFLKKNQKKNLCIWMPLEIKLQNSMVRESRVDARNPCQ